MGDSEARGFGMTHEPRAATGGGAVGRAARRRFQAVAAEAGIVIVVAGGIASTRSDATSFYTTRRDLRGDCPSRRR
jgi:hypothetical protein